MDFDNLLFENGKEYTPMGAYGRSKLANLLFTYELQRLFEKHGINSTAVASHPGGSITNLGRYVEKKFWFRLLKPVMYLLAQSAAQGALTQIRAAVDKNVKGSQYIGPHKNMTGYPIVVESNEASHNMEDARKLWEISEKLTGVTYNFN
jgi:NAD(P)-dependent dehydrogenase (short-subunit alcohol dehydrogenase family)